MPAAAFNPLSPVCKVGGLLSGAAGKACAAVQHPGRVVDAGKKLLSGHPLGAVKAALGDAPPRAASAASVAAIVAWVAGGADFALKETSKVLSRSTSPQLRTTWFSSTYWRVAGIAAVLTMPFLFAAAVQAILRSDLALLARATLGYLPLAMLAVAAAAPVTTLLLAASDECSAAVSSAAGAAGGRALAGIGFAAGIASLAHGSTFLVFLVGVFTVAGAVVLWLELLAREAAVYVVVLMLPLAFAALVWPARRVWAVRAVELLVALILAKFAIVAVLALGSAALGRGPSGGVGGMIVGLVLVTMSAFAPWVLLRLIPLAELASTAAGSFRREARAVGTAMQAADRVFAVAKEWPSLAVSGMRREADDWVSRHGGGFSARVHRPSAAVNGASAQTNGGPAAETNGARARETPAAETERLTDVPFSQGAPAANATDEQPAQRNPGMGPMFQQEDWSWDPIVLDLDADGGAPRVRWAPDGAPVRWAPDGAPEQSAPDAGPRHPDGPPKPPPQDQDPL